VLETVVVEVVAVEVVVVEAVVEVDVHVPHITGHVALATFPTSLESKQSEGKTLPPQITGSTQSSQAPGMYVVVEVVVSVVVVVERVVDVVDVCGIEQTALVVSFHASNGRSAHSVELVFRLSVVNKVFVKVHDS
jgi:hypothetical protein